MLKFLPICMLYMLLVFAICFPPLIPVAGVIYLLVYRFKRNQHLRSQAALEAHQHSAYMAQIRKDWGS